MVQQQWAKPMVYLLQQVLLSLNVLVIQIVQPLQPFAVAGSATHKQSVYEMRMDLNSMQSLTGTVKSYSDVVAPHG